jgi:hypothetical protein
MSHVSYASRKVDVCDGNAQIFDMHLVLEVDTWKKWVKIMEMGASVSEKHAYHLQWLQQFSFWLC